MAKGALRHTLEYSMIIFRHMTLCREVKQIFGKLMLDPAFINRHPAGSAALFFKDALLSTNGLPLEEEHEFILTNHDLLAEIQSVFNYAFFVVADESYLKDHPVFFDEYWDDRLSIGNLICLGWAVYAFAEPAIMFGLYPITVDEMGTEILKENTPQHINEFGLISTHELAEQYAQKNNEVDASEDANSGHWKVLGVFVEKTTFERLNNLLRNQSEIQDFHPS